MRFNICIPRVTAAGDDLLGALPDDVLHHVVSFLPAQQAVQTCMLAQSWRNMWKFATSLRIVHRNIDGPESVNAVQEFIDHLLRFRGGGSPLDTCELTLSGSDFNEDDLSCVSDWIQQILKCNVQELSLGILWEDDFLELNRLTLVSEHLRRLKLYTH